MKEEIKTKITAYSALIIFHAIILILFFTIGNEKTDYEDERPYNIIPVDSVKITNGNLDLHIEIVKQLSSIILGSEQISPVLVERGKKEIDFIVSNIKLPETANFELIKRYVNLILQEQAEYSIIKDWHNNDDKEVF